MIIQSKKATAFVCPIMTTNLDLESRYCVGDACMFWRKLPVAPTHPNAGKGFCGQAYPSLMKVDEMNPA